MITGQGKLLHQRKKSRPLLNAAPPPPRGGNRRRGPPGRQGESIFLRASVSGRGQIARSLKSELQTQLLQCPLSKHCSVRTLPRADALKPEAPRPPAPPQTSIAALTVLLSPTKPSLRTPHCVNVGTRHYSAVHAGRKAQLLSTAVTFKSQRPSERETSETGPGTVRFPSGCWSSEAMKTRERSLCLRARGGAG